MENSNISYIGRKNLKEIWQDFDLLTKKPINRSTLTSLSSENFKLPSDKNNKQRTDTIIRDRKVKWHSSFSSPDLRHLYVSYEKSNINHKCDSFSLEIIESKAPMLPDFLKRENLDKIRAFQDVIDLMIMDLESSQNTSQNNIISETDGHIEVKKEIPLESKEKTPAEMFALKLLNSPNFVKDLLDNQKIGVIIKTHIVPFLMEEDFLKPFLEKTVENLKKVDQRRGIQNKVNNILVRAYKAGDFSNEKYEGKENELELKIMDMYNAVFNFYNQLSCSNSLIKYT